MHIVCDVIKLKELRSWVVHRMASMRGFSLLEVLIAILILAVLIAGFFPALETASKVLAVTNEHQKAITLAENEMEYVKNQRYSKSYSPTPIPIGYTGYSATIFTEDISARDQNIQDVKITVSYQGKPIILHEDCTLEGYKVN